MLLPSHCLERESPPPHTHPHTPPHTPRFGGIGSSCSCFWVWFCLIQVLPLCINPFKPTFCSPPPPPTALLRLSKPAHVDVAHAPTTPLRLNSIQQLLYGCCSVCVARAQFPAGGPAFKDSLSSARASWIPCWPHFELRSDFAFWADRLPACLRPSPSSVCRVPQKSPQSLWSCISLTKNSETFQTLIID